MRPDHTDQPTLLDSLRDALALTKDWRDDLAAGRTVFVPVPAIPGGLKEEDEHDVGPGQTRRACAVSIAAWELAHQENWTVEVTFPANRGEQMGWMIERADIAPAPPEARNRDADRVRLLAWEMAASWRPALATGHAVGITPIRAGDAASDEVRDEAGRQLLDSLSAIPCAMEIVAAETGRALEMHYPVDVEGEPGFGVRYAETGAKR